MNEKWVDVKALRYDFPILSQLVNGKPLVYLDNAASTHKPWQVVEAIDRFYFHDNANIHRGVHTLSERATEAYEKARLRVQHYIHAASPDEVIFVSGTTAAINLVAQSYGRSKIQAGDEIIISEMEHHSNIVPWQILCEQVGAKLRVIPVSDAGDMDMVAYQGLLNDRTKMVAVTHASNVLGTVNPVKEMIDIAHAAGVPVLIDGAQSVQHFPVDVQALDCDFYAFSGHKVYAPTGIGVLYGKREQLDAMPPCYGGGGMISQVRFDHTDYAALPSKFEAGTPNVAAAVGLGIALDYLSAIDPEAIAQYEAGLLDYAKAQLSQIAGLRILGSPKKSVGVVSFVMDDAHPHDIGTILDQAGVAVRAGHHCCMPLMERFGVPATVRASFGIYNTLEDVDALVKGLGQVKRIFSA